MSGESAPVVPPDADTGSTYVAVTPRDRGEGKEGRGKGGEEAPGRGPTRPRERGRARDGMLAAAEAVTHGVRLHGVSWRREKTAEESAAPDIHEGQGGAPRHFWRDGPAPAADLVAYTRSGAWLQGKRNDALEIAGKAWGYGIALPLTVLLGALIWSVHRFHRALVVAIVVAVLWVSFPNGADESTAVAPQIGAAP